MKKFYISIFTVVFLLSFFVSKAVTYNSILTNPTNLTLDDPAFWQGGVSPLNPCVNCIINVNTSVTVARQGGSTFPPDNAGPYINHITLDSSVLRINGSATAVSINSYVSLKNGSQVLVGTDPAYAVTLTLNDQADMDASSSFQLGNINCSLDVNNAIGLTPLLGPYDDFANPGNPIAGVYGILPAPQGSVSYCFVLTIEGSGTKAKQYNTTYNLNCSLTPPGTPNVCTNGIVYGPALTAVNANPSLGVNFIQSTTLPVVLVQFLATKTDDGSVKVSWATSQETNSGYFDVERSGSQTGGWIKIGTIQAKGNSSITSNYSLIDHSPLDGTGFYRLKMVDLDAKFVYSKTVSVSTLKNNLPLVVYSNPFTDQVRLKVNVGRAQNLTMSLTDMLGRTFINQNYQAKSGDNYVNLLPNVGGSGMYILHIHGDTYDQTVKLEKQ